MKTIHISNSLFGKLWSQALESDETEQDILERVLGNHGRAEAPEPRLQLPAVDPANDFFDAKYGVRFPAGTVIFRTYRGERREAEVVAGHWQVDGKSDALFSSLSDLNRYIGAVTENAWYSWNIERDGKRMKIGDLRDPSRVVKRTKKPGDSVVEDESPE